MTFGVNPRFNDAPKGRCQYSSLCITDLVQRMVNRALDACTKVLEITPASMLSDSTPEEQSFGIERCRQETEAVCCVYLIPAADEIAGYHSIAQ